MSAPKGNKFAKGGKREGAGRKASEATLLKRRLIQDKVSEAEESFAFLVQVRDDDEESTSYRLEASKEILNRVLGKAVEMKHDDDNKLRYDRYFQRLDKFLSDAIENESE